MTISALRPALQPSLALFADVALHPAFTQGDLDRVKGQMIAGVEATRANPAANTSRLLPRLIYGPSNAYGRLTTGQSLGSVDRNAVRAFYDRWFHPDNATIVVAGDTNLAEIRPMIEAAFGAWRPAPLPATLVPQAAATTAPVIYLVDKPGAPQTVIKAALIAPPRSDSGEAAREVFATALGGSFTSRLNMKLREEKGWAYGASGGFSSTRGVRMLVASASVQSDKSAESMYEMAAILGDIGKDRPLVAPELAAARDNLTLGLGNDWATSAGIASYLVDESAGGLPENYYAGYPAAIAGVTLDQTNAAASAITDGKPLTWVVIGDRAKIESAIRALGLGEVRIVDADGDPMKE